MLINCMRAVPWFIEYITHLWLVYGVTVLHRDTRKFKWIDLSFRLDMLFAAANTWFSLFARICEYSANTPGAIWKMYFEGLIHVFYCFFGYICIALGCKKHKMQLIWLTFEIIGDLDFQEWIQAQAKLTKRPKDGHFRGANTCEYLKCDIWYSREYQIVRIPNSRSIPTSLGNLFIFFGSRQLIFTKKARTTVVCC